MTILASSLLQIGGGIAISLEAMRRTVEVPSQNLKRQRETQGGEGVGVVRKVEWMGKITMKKGRRNGRRRGWMSAMFVLGKG